MITNKICASSQLHHPILSKEETAALFEKLFASIRAYHAVAEQLPMYHQLLGAVPRPKKKNRDAITACCTISFHNSLEQAMSTANPADRAVLLAAKNELTKSFNALLDARNDIILANLRLVNGVALEHARSSSQHEDLYQEGINGLVQAIENYDPKRGVKFSTYAHPWIVQNIGRYRFKDRAVPVPYSANIAAQKCRKAERALKITGKTPTQADIATQAGVQEELLIEQMASLQPAVCIDDLLSQSNAGFTYQPTFMTEIGVRGDCERAQKAMKTAVRKKYCSPEEVAIATTFWLSDTPAEVCRKYRLDEAAVRGIDEKVRGAVCRVLAFPQRTKHRTVSSAYSSVAQ